MAAKKTASAKKTTPTKKLAPAKKVPTKPIVDLLKDAGFETIEPQNDRVTHASTTGNFSKAHAVFLKTSRNHPELIGSTRLDSLSGPTLVVHVREAEVADSKPEAE